MKKIGNLEPVKRAFSNKEYQQFQELLEQQSPPFRYLAGTYRGAEEFEGRPDFILHNRNKGFLQSDPLEKNRAYLFVAFSCFRKEGKLVFQSYWIVNTEDPLEQLLEDELDSFELNEVDLTTIIEGFKTGGAESTVALNYLH